MRHLKKFSEIYERLMANTYLNAANKAKKIGHEKRSKRLSEYSDVIRKIEREKLTKDRFDEAKKLGTYNMTITSYANREILLKGSFYIYLFIEKGTFIDDFRSWSEGDGITLNLTTTFCIAPADEETKEKFDKLIVDSVYLGFLYVGSLYLNISEAYHNDNDNDRPILKPMGILSMGDDGDYQGIFSDRRSAIKFKKSIIDIFNNKIVYGEDQTPGGIKGFLMEQFSEHNISTEELKDVLSSFNRISINTLYKD